VTTADCTLPLRELPAKRWRPTPQSGQSQQSASGQFAVGVRRVQVPLRWSIRPGTHASEPRRTLVVVTRYDCGRRPF